LIIVAGGKTWRVLGGTSESERQHVQGRVRAAVDAQVVNGGKHQGGAPYGYVVVDGGPHPNPREAAEGYRLRVLASDELSAEVVRRIFAGYLAGHGDQGDVVEADVRERVFQAKFVDRVRPVLGGDAKRSGVARGGRPGGGAPIRARSVAWLRCHQNLLASRCSVPAI
jgi:hypothetical protein